MRRLAPRAEYPKDRRTRVRVADRFRIRPRTSSSASRGGTKSPVRCQRLHCAIAASCRNEACRRCTAVEGKIEGPLRPMERFIWLHEWRLHQNKRAQFDTMGTQRLRQTRRRAPASCACSAAPVLRDARFQAPSQLRAVCGRRSRNSKHRRPTRAGWHSTMVRSNCPTSSAIAA